MKRDCDPNQLTLDVTGIPASDPGVLPVKPSRSARRRPRRETAVSDAGSDGHELDPAYFPPTDHMSEEELKAGRRAGAVVVALSRLDRLVLEAARDGLAFALAADLARDQRRDASKA